MTANLVSNVRDALKGFLLEGVYCWLDSLSVIESGRSKGKNTSSGGCGYQEQPADLGSSGGKVSECLDLWWHRPSWLPYQDRWPENIVTTPTEETQAEAKIMKELLRVTAITDDQLDLMMRIWELWKAIRICSWVTHQQQSGTAELSTSRESLDQSPLTRQPNNDNSGHEDHKTEAWAQTNFKEDKQHLNLQKNAAGIFECRGRIQGVYPIYLPDDAVFAEKLVMYAHLHTLHGWVGLTMASVRECYWVPRRRCLTKRVIQSCYGCKRYQITALANPPTGSLPKERTEGSVPFNYTGVDFAGPVKYLSKSKREMKAYIVLFACCLTRSVYLEILPNLSVEEFICSIKRLITRRGCPEKIFSDNGKTFAAAAKWLRKIRNDEKLNDLLAKQGIAW